MHDALSAWAGDDFVRVAVLAPLAVEHLGKAVLWRKNRALLVPLTPDAEQSLMSLAIKPEVASPKLRTIGLSAVLRRAEHMLGGLPIDAKRRSRMVEIRNGAVHVGASAQSRHVLLDALAVCKALLDRLEKDPRTFFGVHTDVAFSLISEKRSEVGHRVAAKLARAGGQLRDLEERLGRDIFKEVTDRLAAQAALDLPRLHSVWICGRPTLAVRSAARSVDYSATSMLTPTWP
jgi:hypothetical protein